MVDAGVHGAAVDRDVVHAADALERARRTRPSGSRAQLDVDGVAAQLALELLGRALDHDPAAVDDRQPPARRSASSR